MNEIASGKKYPFEKTISLNIGNPQAVGQGFISFNREVRLKRNIYKILFKWSIQILLVSH